MNKAVYTRQVQVRFDPETHEHLKKFAKSKKLKLATVARLIIQKHLPDIEGGWFI